MALDTILDRVGTYGCPLVEVTGGEPLHQPGALVLLIKLCDAGHQVMIETSGAFDISPIDPRVSIIMDVKCPGSGMADRMRWANMEHLSQKDEVKFVLKDQADYEWARDIVKQYSLGDQCPVLFSPVFGSLDLQPLAEWILSDRLPVRFKFNYISSFGIRKPEACRMIHELTVITFGEHIFNYSKEAYEYSGKEW